MGQSILGDAPDELIVPSFSSIGYNILRNIGWNPHNLIEKEVNK